MIDQLRKLIKTVDPASATPADCRAMLDFVQAAMAASAIRSDPIRSDPIRSDPIRSDPIRSDPIHCTAGLCLELQRHAKIC
jgi:hypothetical protein